MLLKDGPDRNSIGHPLDHAALFSQRDHAIRADLYQPWVSRREQHKDE